MSWNGATAKPTSRGAVEATCPRVYRAPSVSGRAAAVPACAEHSFKNGPRGKGVIRQLLTTENQSFLPPDAYPSSQRRSHYAAPHHPVHDPSVSPVAPMLVGAGDRGAIAGTATPNVAGTWEGTWRHRQGSGQITLRLAQEGTTVTGRQSVVGVTPLFGAQRRRIGRQIKLGQEVRDGHIEDSTLIFHVQALDLPGRQVNFTLTI